MSGRPSAAAMKVAAKNSVCGRVVFVDGMARAGKSLACRILSHLKGGEHWQLHGAIQTTCFAHFLGLIGDDFAAGYIQNLVEEFTYERIIGRNLNTRPEDMSAIDKSPDAGEYLRRAREPAGPEVVARFRRDNRFPVFDLHSTMRSAPLMFRALPWAQYIHLARHPVEQAHRWHARGWGDRELEDPLCFGLLIDTADGRVPWYAAGWAGRYLALDPMGRAVETVLRLHDEDEQGYLALDDEQRQQVLRVCFEDLVFAPEPVIGKISGFMKAPVLEPMAAMLAEERCPRPNDLDARRRVFDEIAREIDAELAERLHRAATAHEARWGQDTIVP